MDPKYWLVGPAPLSIPKRDSMKANTHAISFLDLSGELRNKIYASLFTFADPLRLCKSEGQEVHLHRRAGDRNKELPATKSQFYRYSDIEYDRDVEYNNDIEHNGIHVEGFTETVKNIYEPPDLVSVRLPALGFLFSCGQIYHEATSIFYGSNMFAISRMNRALTVERRKKVYWEHAIEERRDYEMHDSKGRYMANGAIWLKNLGSQMRLLRHVVIDLNNLCLIDCRRDPDAWPNEFMGQEYFDIRPLLYVMWSRNVPLDVSFTYVGEQAPNYKSNELLPIISCHASPDGCEAYLECDTAALTRLFRVLVKDDLDIRKYKNLIGQIGVHRDGLFGFVTYKTTNRHEGTVKLGPSHRPLCAHGKLRGWHDSAYHTCSATRNLFESLSGLDYHWLKQEAVGLLEIPVCIQAIMFQRFLFPEGSITIDIDKRTDLGPATGLLFTSSVLRTDWESIYWAENFFQLECTSTEPQTSFSEFQSLRRWLGAGARAEYPFNARRHYWLHRSRGFSINLQFDLNDNMPLEDLRVSIMSFFFATSHLENYIKVNFIIRHNEVDRRCNIVAEQSVTLRQLRDNTLVALRKIEENAGQEYAVPDSLCPEVWMNGLGEAVEFSRQGNREKRPIPNPDKVPNGDFRLRKDEKLHTGGLDASSNSALSTQPHNSNDGIMSATYTSEQAGPSIENMLFPNYLRLTLGRRYINGTGATYFEAVCANGRM